GVNWTNHFRLSVSVDGRLESISFGGGVWVAVETWMGHAAEFASVWASSNGTEWNRGYGRSATWLRDVAYGADGWLVIGVWNGPVRWVVTSSDGLNWNGGPAST